MAWLLEVGRLRGAVERPCGMQATFGVHHAQGGVLFRVV